MGAAALFDGVLANLINFRRSLLCRAELVFGNRMDVCRLSGVAESNSLAKCFFQFVIIIRQVAYVSSHLCFVKLTSVASENCLMSGMNGSCVLMWQQR